ncbi:hypothetical protein NDU88_002646 [Pleurodeles waltl]|uniref:Uncharacterized protein n=1 Tax=Pleurodeles waltl TaxID=8319 RepID=A0AAV7T2Z9_PLEWA|nr:hypothetical protein NDU88_002646 [Pleurodeles waltl]
MVCEPPEHTGRPPERVRAVRRAAVWICWQPLEGTIFTAAAGEKHRCCWGRGCCCSWMLHSPRCWRRFLLLLPMDGRDAAGSWLLQLQPVAGPADTQPVLLAALLHILRPEPWLPLDKCGQSVREARRYGHA